MKNLIYDLLNGFTPSDIFLMSVQLFASLFIGQCIRFIAIKSKKQFVPDMLMSTIIPVVICFMVIISRNSAPLAIAFVGVLILTGKLSLKKDSLESLVLFLLATAGFACGSGFVIPALLVYVFIILPVLYFF